MASPILNMDQFSRKNSPHFFSLLMPSQEPYMPAHLRPRSFPYAGQNTDYYVYWIKLKVRQDLYAQIKNHR